MPRLPKLKIKLLGTLSDEVYDLEEIKDYLNFDEGTIMVEGQNANSYDKLVQLVTQEKYKDLEYINVVVLPAIIGG